MSKNSAAFIPSFNNLENANVVFSELENLCSERKGWEQNEYKTSTSRLYKLLAAIYEIFEEEFVKATNDDRRTLRGQLVGKLNVMGINVRKSTDTLGLLIRYVFQADRRRVMSYKYAILAAKSQDIEPSELEDWLVDEGGLEEVVRKVSFSQKTLDRRASVQNIIDRVQKTISTRIDSPLATVTVPVGATCDRVMLLAEPCGSGDFKVLFVFENPSDGVQKALIRKVASVQAGLEVEDKVNKAEVTNFINFNKITKPDELVTA